MLCCSKRTGANVLAPHASHDGKKTVAKISGMAFGASRQRQLDCVPDMSALGMGTEPGEESGVRFLIISLLCSTLPTPSRSCSTISAQLYCWCNPPHAILATVQQPPCEPCDNRIQTPKKQPADASSVDHHGRSRSGQGLAFHAPWSVPTPHHVTW